MEVLKDITKFPTVELFEELGNRGFYLENRDYFSKKMIMRLYDIKAEKANVLAKEFEKEVKKGEFYTEMAIIRYSTQIWEVHKKQFRHFLKYKKDLNKKNMRKYVPKYNPCIFD